MTDLSYWDWLTLKRTELIARGVPWSEVGLRRRRITGHPRQISARWLPAFGSWGRIRNIREIAQLVGLPSVAVKDHARPLRLQLATQRLRYTPSQLAVALWCDRGRAPRDSCHAYGVLQGERVLYCAAVEVILAAGELAIPDILHAPVADLDAVWEHLGLHVGPPDVGPGLGWTDALMPNANRLAVQRGRSRGR